MTEDLRGKAVLITGAGSGIGRAAALAFSAVGARVMVSDAAAAAGAIVQAGGEARFRPCDVTVSADVAGLVAATVAAFGRLDCAFNNAGIEGPGGLTHLYDEGQWQRVIAVNLFGVWLCMKHQIAQMLDQGGGAIVNTASIAGLVTSLGNGSAYTASKHGVIGATKAAALEYVKAGMRVNAVCPGPIQTAMTERMDVRYPGFLQRAAEATPAGRMGAPEEVAQAVLWLCSDAASFVTGHSLVVDGGFTVQ